MSGLRRLPNIYVFLDDIIIPISSLNIDSILVRNIYVILQILSYLLGYYFGFFEGFHSSLRGHCPHISLGPSVQVRSNIGQNFTLIQSCRSNELGLNDCPIEQFIEDPLFGVVILNVDKGLSSRRNILTFSAKSLQMQSRIIALASSIGTCFNSSGGQGLSCEFPLSLGLPSASIFFGVCLFLNYHLIISLLYSYFVFILVRNWYCKIIYRCMWDRQRSLISYPNAHIMLTAIPQSCRLNILHHFLSVLGLDYLL